MQCPMHCKSRPWACPGTKKVNCIHRSAKRPKKSHLPQPRLMLFLPRKVATDASQEKTKKCLAESSHEIHLQNGPHLGSCLQIFS